jgi:nitrogen fixation protein FixH
MARKKGWQWPWIVGGLMAVVLGANLTLMYVATSDPSFAVEEDYYQKALDWDDKRAQDRANIDLGWSLQLAIAANRSADGTTGLTVNLVDREGRPITDAKIHLEAFHNARAASIQKRELAHEGDGRYSTSLLVRRPGLWEFRFDVSRGGQRFTRTIVEELIRR